MTTINPVTIAALAVGSSALAGETAVSKPNIVFIMADDMGYSKGSTLDN